MALALAAPTVGADASPVGAQMEDCHEVVVFVPASYDDVRRRVPASYPLVLDDQDRALLFVRIARCAALTVNGSRRSAVVAQVASVIHAPDGADCAADTLRDAGLEREGLDSTVEGCSWFALSWTSDHAELIAWLRRHGARGITHATGFAFEDVADLDFDFKASTPADVPMPFTMAGTVGPSTHPAVDLAVAYWFDTPAGRLRVGGATADGLLTGIGRLQVCAPAGSPLAQMMASDTGCQDAGDVLTSNRFGRGWYRAAPFAAPPPESGCDERCAADLAVARDWTHRYQSVAQAVADGYVPIGDCEAGAEGAMGTHYARLDDENVELSLKRPEVLLYVPSRAGPRLAGVEYMQSITVDGNPYAAADPPPDAPGVFPAEPPALFGRQLDGPMPGHPVAGLSGIQPWHYDLHVWAWAPNPAGMFRPWNPSLACGDEHA